MKKTDIQEIAKIVDRAIDRNQTILAHGKAIGEVRESLHFLGIKVEKMDGDIALLVEGVSTILKRTERYETVEDSVKQHEDRIKLLEVTVTKHLADSITHT